MAEEERRHRLNGRPPDGDDIDQLWRELRRHEGDLWAHPAMRGQMVRDLHLDVLWDERNQLKAWIAAFSLLGAVVGGLIGAGLPLFIHLKP